MAAYRLRSQATRWYQFYQSGAWSGDFDGLWGMDDLRAAGWPDPVVPDSGNGAHLLYGVDLPNDSRTTELVKGILAGVAARCATDDVTVDQTVFNAGRITKVYGTMVCKGDNLPDRPHRRSRLLEIPDHLVVLEEFR
jgi:hypothetical protein